MTMLENVRARSHLLLIAVFVLTALVLVLVWPRSHLDGADAYDYAQMGHQIATGHGFTTLQVFPRHIPWLKAHGYLGGAAPPNLYRYPLTPLADSIVEFFTGDPERAAILQSGIWFLLTIPVLYFLALEFLSPAAALLCVLLFLCQPGALGTGHDGLTESLATLLTTVAIYLTFHRAGSRWWLFALGAACGLAYLCRTQLAVLLPWSVACCFFASTQKFDRRSAAGLVAGAAAPVLPWAVRNLAVSGSPTFSFSNTRNLAAYVTPRSDIELDLHGATDTGRLFHQFGGGIFDKIHHNLWPSILDPLALTSNTLGAVLLVLAVITIPLLFQDKDETSRRTGAFLLSTVLLILLNFAATTPLRIDPRFYVVLGPALIVAGVQAVIILASRFGGANYVSASIGAATVLCAVLFALRLASLVREAPSSETDRASYAQLAKATQGRGVVASDESYKIALYSHMYAVRFPSDPSQLFEISSRYLPIEYVVVSRAMIRASESKGYKAVGYDAYPAFFNSREFKSAYKRLVSLPNGANVYQLRNKED